MSLTAAGERDSKQATGTDHRPARQSADLHCAEHALDPLGNDQWTARIVVSESDRTATNHTATFPREAWMPEISFNRAVPTQECCVDPGEPSVDIDHLSNHRR
jgi:hypothetical protein